MKKQLYIPKTIRHIIAFIVLLTTGIATASAQKPEADSTRFSIITCAPGTEIWSLFGHTAIRYEDPARGIDIDFNYGIFNFHEPNFIWRFVKGETDYRLGVEEHSDFMLGYIYRNREVWQQTLNLTAEEKQKLLEVLLTNYKPENQVYRYNFLYDNCATRPIDRIEDCLNGTLVFQGEDGTRSFRNIIHESSANYPWERFGMDFCLGPEADQPITYRQEMFSPLYLMAAFAKATVVENDGTIRPLVADTKTLFKVEEPGKADNNPFTPFRTFLLLFIVITALTIYGIKKQKSLWVIDLLLFAAAGIAGCVLLLLNFFSEHPAVSPNYLIIAFHPLYLLLLPFFLRKEYKGKRSWFHQINSIVLTLFILSWPFISQYINPVVVPLALSLLVRNISNLVLTHKKTR